MRMFFFLRIAVRSAFFAAALGLTVIVTVPPAAERTPKDWMACWAASYSVSPAWLARSVQVPGPTNVTVEPEGAPESVQTPGVAEERAGGRPEVALAVTT